MIDLPDINVWLALIDRRHVHHEVASRYWSEQSADTLAFCRTTMLGFMRLATHERVMKNPLSTLEAWSIYRQFMALPNVCLLMESADLDQHFMALSLAPGFSQRLWTDAYLAAFASASGCRLVSFDGDFKRFGGLHFLQLEFAAATAPVPPSPRPPS